MHKHFHITMSTTQIIMFSFFFTIIIGSILLSLPISSANGQSVPYLDALFTATTSTCVTGLVTLPVVSTWSTFGQVIILILIQIGGLGIVTIMSGLMLSFHKKMGLKDKILLQDAFNLNSLSGLINFTKKVILGTFVIESLGALIYMTVFIPEYGMKGIWISIFTSISAFCNAGIDIISENSLCDYTLNSTINVVTSLLIIIGGIGYIVWWDIIRVLKNIKKLRFKIFKNLTLHSKIVLSVTILLIVAGTMSVFAFEYYNPLTIGSYSFFDKIKVAFFQSVTTRTAGFAMIPQQNLTNASAIVCLLLMFIGGSPVGTAGGIKTVTFAILIASMLSTVKNKTDISLFNRNIPPNLIRKAVAVVSMSFIIMFISTLLLASTTDACALDIAYETISATATVGLTRNLTPTLNIFGKIIIIVTMFLGRIGPISLAVAFSTKKQTKNIIKNPTEEIIVG
ncbi:MAG: potassium transporter KtrB [Lachnospiraceae bacterium]|nr:potassium transporter KtrB [Lachnospiraceae bacterium]